MAILSVEARTQLRTNLLELAQQDSRLIGAAGRQDRWSDIDLAFGVADPARVGEVLAHFSAFIYPHGALHHHDVIPGAWTYRVLFLPGGLQVDLAFVEQNEFRPLGPAFDLVFGNANPVQPLPEPNPREVRLGLAARATRSKLDRTRETLAGRIHDQRSSRLYLRTGASGWAFLPHMAAARTACRNR